MQLNARFNPQRGRNIAMDRVIGAKVLRLTNLARFWGTADALDAAFNYGTMHDIGELLS